MGGRTIHLSERSKQLYAQRRTQRHCLQDMRLPQQGSMVRAFMRPHKRVQVQSTGAGAGHANTP